MKSVELGQTRVALSFGPAVRPNSSRAALKALGQEIWALHLTHFFALTLTKKLSLNEFEMSNNFNKI